MIQKRPLTFTPLARYVVKVDQGCSEIIVGQIIAKSPYDICNYVTHHKESAAGSLSCTLAIYVASSSQCEFQTVCSRRSQLFFVASISQERGSLLSKRSQHEQVPIVHMKRVPRFSVCRLDVRSPLRPVRLLRVSNTEGLTQADS